MRQLDPTRITSPLPLIRASEAHIDEYEYKIMIDAEHDDYPELTKRQKELIHAWNSTALTIDLTHPSSCSMTYTDTAKLLEKADNEDQVRNRLIFAVKNLSRQPYNATLFEQMACLLQSLAYRSVSQGYQKQNSSVIGSGANSGVMGGLFSTIYRPIIFPKGAPPLFLLKTALSVEDQKDRMNSYANYETLNEAIVGILTTNKLRRLIPTFMYIYGTFLAPAKQEKPFDSNNAYAHYNMVETLVDAVTFGRYIDRLSPTNENFRRVYEVLCQIFLALIVAKRAVGFIHCDLSVENVMVQKLNKRMTIEFPGSGINGGDMYVTTDLVARIIDFGRAQVKVPIEDGSVFTTGRYSWDLALEPGNSSSIYDFTRLIGTLENIFYHRGYPHVGMEFLDPLMGPKRLLYNRAISTQWSFEGWLMSPYVGDVDPAEVFYLALPNAMKRCADAGFDLKISDQRGPEPLLNCGEDSECVPYISPSVFIPTTPSVGRVLPFDESLQKHYNEIRSAVRYLKPELEWAESMGKIYDDYARQRISEMDYWRMTELSQRMTAIRDRYMRLLSVIAVRGAGLHDPYSLDTELDWINMQLKFIDTFLGPRF